MVTSEHIYEVFLAFSPLPGISGEPCITSYNAVAIRSSQLDICSPWGVWIDHRHINFFHIVEFSGFVSTAKIIAKHIYGVIVHLKYICNKMSSFVLQLCVKKAQ